MCVNFPIYIYIYIYIYMCVCVYDCLCVCVCVCVQIVNFPIYIYVYIYTYMRVFECMCECVCKFVNFPIYMYIYLSICGCVFRVFPSPRLVASPRLKDQSVLLFTHSWRENNWIHTFPKGMVTINIDQYTYECVHV